MMAVRGIIRGRRSRPPRPPDEELAPVSRPEYDRYMTNLLLSTSVWCAADESRLELRQEDRKSAALAHLAVDLESAAVAADDVLDDGKPEARTPEITGAGRIHPVEALGQPRQMLTRDAFPLIDDSDRHRGSRRRHRRRRFAGPGEHPDGAAGAAIFQGVVDQVLEQLDQLVLVALDRRQRAQILGQLDGHAAGGSLHGEAVGDACEHGVEAHALGGHAMLVELDA